MLTITHFTKIPIIVDISREIEITSWNFLKESACDMWEKQKRNSIGHRTKLI
jgi:hypothetical protein